MGTVSKAELRQQLLAWRRQLSDTELKVRSKRMTEQAIQHISYQNVRSMHSYLPIEKNREVDTWPLLRYVWHEWPECMVAVPLLRSNKLASMHVTSKTVWKTGALGQPEPQNGSQVADTWEYDVIIVPLLGFTRGGYRLGYGGGNYDKFLAAQPNALTVGLCYDEGLVEFEPEPHDIPLKLIITDQKMYQL